MCGEHRLRQTPQLPPQGSSPHVRGARWGASSLAVGLGIIPACAGSTSAQTLLLSILRDHPRMCGEHAPCLRLWTCQWGSSPHVRGALVANPLTSGISGIIPACAGSTGVLFESVAPARDHPRMCGEHDCVPLDFPLDSGSSPHVRGAPDLLFQVIQCLGIIPACAGSTLATPSGRRTHGDHPRMCGEHMAVTGYQDAPWGSSPHVRGAPQSPTAFGNPHGIIPACAGSTFRPTMADARPRDHPRMCGEHIKYTLEGATSQGSSPHVRGAQNGESAKRRRHGIIPACAGSTYSGLFQTVTPRDHPRMCGEHCF